MPVIIYALRRLRSNTLGLGICFNLNGAQERWNLLVSDDSKRVRWSASYREISFTVSTVFFTLLFDLE